MAEFNGYITNLGKYNGGSLVGEWISFPISDEDLQAALQRIGIGSADSFGASYEEYFFTDWELPDGLDWQVLGETPDIETVNAIAEAYQNTNYPDDVVSAVIEHYSYDIDEAVAKLNNGDFLYYPNVYDAKSLGEYTVNNIDDGVQNLSTETLQNYFDFEAYGRDIEISGSVEYINSGAIEFLK